MNFLYLHILSVHDKYISHLELALSKLETYFSWFYPVYSFADRCMFNEGEFSISVSLCST